MKYLILFINLVLLSTAIYAQVPQKMSYQAVVRDANNQVLANTTVGMKISIVNFSEDGFPVYEETHTTTTNANGLVSLVIGEGNILSGTMINIEWFDAPHFIKSETDPTGGTNYSIVGTSQLLSVPYALYAERVHQDQFIDGDADATNEIELPANPENGDVAFYDGEAWQRLPKGTDGQVLTMQNGLPTWKDEPCHFEIGQTYGGGIIFHLDESGCHGLIVAPVDQPHSKRWGCQGTLIDGADGTAIGTGMQNTLDILAGCPSNNNAAAICADLVIQGKDDWYLPSRDELNLIWENLTDLDEDGVNSGEEDPYNISGMSNGYYWSSTELNSEQASSQGFTFGTIEGRHKDFLFMNVRAIRAF